ncbi:MAG TPA: diacylglycerol kinase family protein [Vicinamibacteria bacterium]|nr:diacylglycerol kinase family protein [Vicinamibacteria bacterium]
MKIRAIVNLRAGVAAHRALDAFEAGLPSWPSIEVRLTEGPAHATALAREAVEQETALVLAAGGDGTVNEVATGLLGSGVPLGIVPVGSGNGLARALRLPLRPDRALVALESGVPRRMDVGQINGRPFLNVAGIGFDAFVGSAFHKAGSKGGRRGILTYVRMSLRLLSLYEAPAVTLELADGRVEARPFILAFSNGVQYGAGAVLNPGGKLNDGRMEVVIFEDAPLLETLATAPRLFLGGIERSRRYRRIGLERAVLTTSQPLEHHRDGEPEPEAARLEVSLLPKSLRVIVPRATAEDPEGPFLPA